MSWKSGSGLAQKVWELIDFVGNNHVYWSKSMVALDLVKLFEDNDCDTMYECAFVEELLDFDEDAGEWVAKD